MADDAVLWIDVSAGVAGDMLLGALVDAGVPLDRLQDAVDAVIPGSVRLTSREVARAGLRATKVEVEVLVADPPHRTWSTIRELLDRADLPDGVRRRALAAFSRLAAAEGRVHGVPPESVHFHEVGALDAIADVVGTCAGVEALGVGTVVASPVALGSGTISAHHGVLPVPAPAVLELSRGWDVLAGGRGELATPTGLALVTTLAAASGPMPAVRVQATGIGAGTRDTEGRANVVRVVLGRSTSSPAGGAGPTASADPAPSADRAPSAGEDHGFDGVRPAVVLEANVDDLDPRVWPVVLDRLLTAGAWDAWLTPILMKKGRPAHTLHVLASPEGAQALTAVVLAHTTTLGVRRTPVLRESLERAWVEVTLGGDDALGHVALGVRVKVGHRDGQIVRAMPEFDDVVAAAGRADRPVAAVLALAHAAAHAAGLVAGASWPVQAPPA